MKNSIRLLSLLLVLTCFVTACKPKEDDHITLVNKEINDMMKEVYLWYQYLPNNVDPASYDDPADYIAALRYETFDRWSTALTTEEFNQYFEEGVMIGHGFMVGLDDADNIRIALVYRNTLAAEKGVKRGWILKKVNGTNVYPSNFNTLMGAAELGITNVLTFIDEHGTTLNVSLSKEEIDLTPVLHYEVIDTLDKHIGYIVFQDFIETANTELDEAFNAFKTAGVDEMIVDLRYNGGGSVAVAEYFSGWLLGKDFGNQILYYLEHNSKMLSYNKSGKIPANTQGLSLARIFFIGTDNTASASELLINGSKPYVTAILAGSTTHGKPVGMYAIPVKDYTTLPVTFKYTNKDHEGDFYDGIDPMLVADDDLSRDFGDPEEASLKAILDYMDSGVIPQKTTKSTAYTNRLIETKQPINQYLRAF